MRLSLLFPCLLFWLTMLCGCLTTPLRPSEYILDTMKIDATNLLKQGHLTPIQEAKLLHGESSAKYRIEIQQGHCYRLAVVWRIETPVYVHIRFLPDSNGKIPNRYEQRIRRSLLPLQDYVDFCADDHGLVLITFGLLNPAQTALLLLPVDYAVAVGKWRESKAEALLRQQKAWRKQQKTPSLPPLTTNPQTPVPKAPSPKNTSPQPPEKTPPTAPKAPPTAPKAPPTAPTSSPTLAPPPKRTP